MGPSSSSLDHEDHEDHHEDHEEDEWNREYHDHYSKKRRIVANTKTALLCVAIFCFALSFLLCVRGFCLKKREGLNNLRKPLLCFDACRAPQDGGRTTTTIVLGTEVVDEKKDPYS